MEYRKLIKFGSNSHVISLPKTWIEKYELKKGDHIGLEIVNDNMILHPKTIKQSEEKVKTITVKKNATPRTLKRELLSAYEKNATTIYFSGPGVSYHLEPITTLIDSLTGLEIVEHTTNRIIAKTYIKTEDVTIETFLKRIDNSIKSMILELQEGISQELPVAIPELEKEISQREKNVDKIVRLIQRVMRERIQKHMTSKEQDQLMILKYWQLSIFLETISDNIEAMVNYFSIIRTETERSEIKSILEDMKTCFDEVMKAFYSNNTQQAYVVSDDLRTVKKKVDDKHKKKGYGYLLRQFEENINIISEINKLSF
ncbi:MAG: AbrB/MazE/SpoVT family DNA-binding domain-containing protein [Nanoarchaeota archaeon]